MPQELEYSGAALALPELTDITIERAIPGARYGVRTWNSRRAAAYSTVLDDAASIGAKLMADMRLAGLNVAAAPAPNDQGTARLRLTSVPGASTGIRIDSSPGSYISTVTPGIAPTAKQFRVTLPLGADGGTWTLTFDFGSGEETTSALGYLALSDSVETAIDALATPTSGDATVQLEVYGNTITPRSYLITVGGSLAGTDFTVTADGDNLTGFGSVEVTEDRDALGNSTAIQALWFPGFGHGPPNQTATLQMRVRLIREGSFSGWVNGVSHYNTDSPGTATFGGVNILTALQAAADQVCGAGQVVVALYYRDKGSVITLKWVNPGSQTAVQLGVDVYDQNTGAAYYTLNTGTSILRQSGANQNEFLLIDIGRDLSDDVADATKYTVTHEGVTTSQVSRIGSVGNTQTRWNELTGDATIHGSLIAYSGDTASEDELVASGTVSVYSWFHLYFVEFTGNRANQNVSAVTLANVTGSLTNVVHMVSQGQSPGNEIHRIVITASGGTFTLSSDGTNYTAALAYNVSAGSLQTALRGLAAIGAGNCTVTGSGTAGDPFLVEYISGKALTDMPLLVATDGNLTGGGNPAVVVTQEPDPGSAQVDQLWIDPNATGGFIRASSDGDFSGNIDWDGTAGETETALEMITAVSDFGLTVSGDDGGPWMLVWGSAGVAPVLTLIQETLTVPISSLIRLVRVQEAQGPNHWNHADNWEPAQVPGTGDIAVLRFGTPAIREGLRQECGWGRSGDLLALDGGDFVVGQIVRLQKSAGGTFPSATISGGGHTLSEATEYTIIGIDRFAQVCQIATSLAAAPIVLTSAGSGTFRIGVLLAEFRHLLTFTGDVGLSQRINGRNEERHRELTIGSTLVNIGLGGQGSGSPLINLGLGTHPARIKQYQSGAARLQGEKATNIRVYSLDSHLKEYGGRLAVSPTDQTGESSLLGSVEVRSASLLLGKVEIGSYDGSDDDLEAPFGFTCTGPIVRN